MDTVSDALIRIKNGYLARKSEVVLPYSKLVKSILEVMKKEGYIENFSEEKVEKNKKIMQLKAKLKYNFAPGSTTVKEPVLTDVKRISKPGLRVYKSKLNLPFVLSGLGIAIISTPKGLMTDRQARKAGTGGEIIAYVW